MAIKGVDGFDRTTPVAGPDQRRGAAGRQALARRREAVDGRRRGVQVRALSVPAPGSRRPTRTSPPASSIRPATCICRRGSTPSGVKQLVAEQLVTVKTRRGFDRLEWQKLRERNETLDCRVYARAAAWVAGIDRFAEARWAQLDGSWHRRWRSTPRQQRVRRGRRARRPAHRTGRRRRAARSHPVHWMTE